MKIAVSVLLLLVLVCCVQDAFGHPHGGRGPRATQDPEDISDERKQRIERLMTRNMRRFVNWAERILTGRRFRLEEEAVEAFGDRLMAALESALADMFTGSSTDSP